MSFLRCSGGGGLDLTIPKRGLFIAVKNRPNANSGGYWGMIFKLSALEDDMTFTITAVTAKTIAAVFVRAQSDLSGTTQGTNRAIYAYNAQLTVATITGAQIKSTLSAAELSTYPYVALDFSCYSGSGLFTFEIS